MIFWRQFNVTMAIQCERNWIASKKTNDFLMKRWQFNSTEAIQCGERWQFNSMEAIQCLKMCHLWHVGAKCATCGMLCMYVYSARPAGPPYKLRRAGRTTLYILRRTVVRVLPAQKKNRFNSGAFGLSKITTNAPKRLPASILRHWASKNNHKCSKTFAR